MRGQRKMTDAIIVALITSGVTLIGVLVTNASNHQKITSQLDTNLKLMEQKIDQLEEKVNKHNNIIDRTYECEEKISLLESEDKRQNERIKELEAKR